MIFTEKQGASSTPGLLSASAVFVGPLVYASFFAFEKPLDTAITDTTGAGFQEGDLPPSVLSPLPAGIFNGETVLNDANEQSGTTE